MKFNKQYLPILILLVGLSGCGNKKKNSTKKKPSKKNEIALLNIPVAGDNAMVAPDQTVCNFLSFDQEIQEFVSLAKDNTNTTAANNTIPNDAKDFTRMNSVSDKEEEFSTIYFDYDQHTIRKDQQKMVDNLAAQVQTVVAEAHKNGINVTIAINGHTDLFGAATYNAALSEKRAKEIASNLVESHNIPKDTIKIVGRGSEMPLVTSGDQQQQSVNRRVEVNAIYS